jgi:protein involved in polysaccharide export with SLBB domain
MIVTVLMWDRRPETVTIMESAFRPGRMPVSGQPQRHPGQAV